MAIDPRFYASTGAATLEDWAKAAGARLIGEPSTPVTGVGAAHNAVIGDVCFFDGEAKSVDLVTPNAAGCFVTEPLAEHLPDGVAALVHGDPRTAHMIAAEQFFTRLEIGAQDHFIHVDATVHDSAILSPGVVIGPGAAIGEDTRIGAHTVIGPGVQIGAGCHIGAHVSIQCALIGNHVSLSSGARLGENGFGITPGDQGLEDMPHFGRVIVQDHVSIGAGSCIDRGAFDDTVIGERTKIDNFCQIAHNCQIGRNVVIAAFAGLSGTVKLEDGVMLGGRVGIADHVIVGKDAKLAASTGLFRNVPDGETWGGTPGKPIRQWMRETAWLNKQISGKSKS